MKPKIVLSQVLRIACFSFQKIHLLNYTTHFFYEIKIQMLKELQGTKALNCFTSVLQCCLICFNVLHSQNINWAINAPEPDLPLLVMHSLQVCICILFI